MSKGSYEAPTLKVVRVKAGFEPFPAKDLGQLELSRDIGTTALVGITVIGGAGELGTGLGRISSVTSPSHWS